MMNSSNSLRLTGAIALFSLAAACSCLAQTSSASSTLFDLFGNKVLAKGEGVEVKQGQLDESLVTIKSTAASRGRPIRPDVEERLEREVLQRLINIQLLLGRASEVDTVNGKAEAEKRLSLLAERAGSEAALARSLTAVGLTPDKLRAKLIEESTAQVVLERELGIEVTEDEVKKFYDENPAKFEQPEMVRAAHILMRTSNPTTNEEFSPDQKAAARRKIEELRERALKGDDFGALAREFTQDELSRDNDGEYTFPRGRMVPVFEATAFSLPAGKISEVIETRYGYHVLKVYEKIPAKTVELTEEVAAEIREFLKTQESRERMGPFMKKLKEEAKVEILVERLQPVEGEEALPTNDPILAPE